MPGIHVYTVWLKKVFENNAAKCGLIYTDPALQASHAAGLYRSLRDVNYSLSMPKTGSLKLAKTGSEKLPPPIRS